MLQTSASQFDGVNVFQYEARVYKLSFWSEYAVYAFQR